MGINSILNSIFNLKIYRAKTQGIKLELQNQTKY